MIRRALAALWSIARPHRQFIVNFLLPIGLSLVACGAAASWSAERDARERNDAAHARERHYADRAMALANANLESISRAYLRATDSLKVLGDGVTTSRVEYRTLRDTILVDLEAARAHSDTPKLLKDLPVFIRKSDDAVAKCSTYQNECEAFHHTADSLIADLRYKNGLLEHRAVWKPPRWTVEGETLYDPFASMPMATGAGTLRIADRVSGVVRGEQRFAPGERPRVYVGIRVTR